VMKESADLYHGMIFKSNSGQCAQLVLDPEICSRDILGVRNVFYSRSWKEATLPKDGQVRELLCLPLSVSLALLSGVEKYQKRSLGLLTAGWKDIYHYSRSMICCQSSAVLGSFAGNR